MKTKKCKCCICSPELENIWVCDKHALKYNIDNNGIYIFRLLSILFLPQKFSYRNAYFSIEGVPIGYIIIIISLIVKFL